MHQESLHTALRCLYHEGFFKDPIVISDDPAWLTYILQLIAVVALCIIAMSAIHIRTSLMEIANSQRIQATPPNQSEHPSGGEVFIVPNRSNPAPRT